MIYPIPDFVSAKIARRAVTLASQRAPRSNVPTRGKHGADQFQPVSSAGQAGITVPPEYGYMMALDRGYDPYVMYGLTGKTIPIRSANGTINFRTAFGSSAPGKRKIIGRNVAGQITETKIMWKNPGMQGLHFIEDSIKQAAMEWKNTADAEEILDIIQATGAAGASFVDRINHMRF